MFYILSEIIPVTIIFLFIILCNISLTSGLANSFLFFAQTVKMLHVRADSLIETNHAVYYLHKIQQFVYFFINLDPFVLDEMAYCIWRNANALDIFVFGNITALYSFVLILLVVFIWSKCNVTCFCRRPRHFKKESAQVNIIRGISSFLLLFTSRCAHNSILILGYIGIYGKGYQRKKTVARYNGEIEWMSTQHLPYAIPALILLIMVSIPPVILMIYPVHYRVLSLFNMSESRCTQFLFNPLEKLKPFVDSFQGCFKDRFRFFAGLFFMYRILLSVLMAVFRPVDTYFSVSVMLALLLLIHAVVQPYVKRLHNIVDVLLIGNLLFINMITAYNVSKLKFTNNADNRSSLAISLTSWVQLLLIFSPLVCFSALLLPLKKRILKLKPFNNELPESLEYGSFSRRHNNN